MASSWRYFRLCTVEDFPGSCRSACAADCVQYPGREADAVEAHAQDFSVIFHELYRKAHRRSALEPIAPLADNKEPQAIVKNI